jgi:ribosomal protein S18 acetylase RimI-like enzyme
MNRAMEEASESPPRVATEDDKALVTRILVDAFDDDPMWGAWAFPEPHTRARYREGVFRQIVEGALRYPWVWLSGDEIATTVWIPPGGREMSTVQEQEVDAVLRESLGGAADRVLRAFEAFDAARPDDPHYYLTMFGSAPRSAGRRIGQRLLSANLADMDSRGAAAYLEASDELVPLYERFGFRLRHRFDLGRRVTVNAMWRDPLPARG